MKKYTFLILMWVLISSCSATYEPRQIEGKVNVSSKLASKVGVSDVLYIFLYEENPLEFLSSDEKITETQTQDLKTSPVPLAVLKIAPLQFPVKFSVSEKDILFPDRFRNQAIYLAARISKSGKVDAVKGEIQGVYLKNPIYFPQNGISLELDQEYKVVKTN